MSGFNLPPGCSARDIPGNRPEDTAAETILNSIYELMAAAGFNPEGRKAEALANALFQLFGEVYSDGYNQGVSDTEMAKEITP